jgi:hypothetical protein
MLLLYSTCNASTVIKLKLGVVGSRTLNFLPVTGPESVRLMVPPSVQSRFDGNSPRPVVLAEKTSFAQRNLQSNAIPS